jgi:hypothetical protein
MRYPQPTFPSLPFLVAALLVGCGGSSTSPSTTAVREALQAQTPPSLVVEDLEVEATLGGPGSVAVRFKGILRAKEALFAPSRENFTAVHPKLENIRGRLMERDTIGVINPIALKKPVRDPLTPAEEQLSVLASGLKSLAENFIVQTSKTGQTFPIIGSTITSYEFKQWSFRDWVSNPIELGQPRNAFPEAALDIHSQEAKAAVAKLETAVSAFESLMDAPEAAKAAERIDAVSKAAEPFIRELRGAVYEGKASEASGDHAPVRITFASKVDWKISPHGVVASLKGTIENIDKANGAGIRTITAELTEVGIGKNNFTISGKGVDGVARPWILSSQGMRCYVNGQSFTCEGPAMRVGSFDKQPNVIREPR